MCLFFIFCLKNIKIKKREKVIIKRNIYIYNENNKYLNYFLGFFLKFIYLYKNRNKKKEIGRTRRKQVREEFKFRARTTKKLTST